MINWIIRPPQLGSLQLNCLEYLTLLMCFGIAGYKQMSVLKCRCGETVRMLWLKHRILGFPHNAQHFRLYPRPHLPTVSLSDPCHCIL